MECRKCGICCIAVSINSPQMSKPAGVKCKHLKTDNTCGVWGNTELQPEVCRSIRPTEDLCFPNLGAKDHYNALIRMDRATRPNK